MISVYHNESLKEVSYDSASEIVGVSNAKNVKYRIIQFGKLNTWF